MYLGYLTNWTDIILRVSNAFHVYSLGIVINSSSECCGVIRSDKLDDNPVFLEEH